MDATENPLTAEKSPSKIAGIVTTQQKGLALVSELTQLPTFAEWQVRLLGPEDAKNKHHEWFSISVEPEPSGVGRTLVWTHVVFGLAGAVAGLLLFAFLYWRSQPMIVASPWFAVMAITAFGTTFGLMAGGLVAARPDHVRLITWIRSALRSNQWVVVAHPTNAAQLEQAERVLRRDAFEVMQTI